jgi:uncharacterized protein
MSESLLPRRADLRKLVARQGRMRGCVPVESLERVCASCLATDGAVCVELGGAVEDDGYRVVRGRIRTELTLQCQRCLGPVCVPLEQDFAWALLWTDTEAEQLPKRYDPLVVEEVDLDLWEAVADEVLLALPIVALHQDGACRPAAADASPDEVADRAPTRNPFAVLEKLKS